MRVFVRKVALGVIFLLSVGLSTGSAEERKTLELRIFGVCPACDSDVRSRALAIPGVVEAKFDLVKKKLFVTLNSESANETKIIIALEQGGYEVRRPFREERLERVALEVSGIKDKSDIIEIERTLYAFYDVDNVGVSNHSDNIIAIIDFKKGGLDPGQLAMSLMDSLPQVGVKIIPSREMLEAQVRTETKAQGTEHQ